MGLSSSGERPRTNASGSDPQTLNRSDSPLEAVSAFSIEHRSDGVAVIWIDVPGEPMNLLRKSDEEALWAALEEVEQHDGARAVVLASKKPGAFVVGPDLDALADIKTVNDGIDRARAGQELTQRIAGLRLPVVAAIDGPCLNSGLEIALACGGRVASSSPAAALGFTEVRLGLLPAMGGTQRLPCLVGWQAALELLLTGDPVDTEGALALGLVDARVSREDLMESAALQALRLAKVPKSAPQSLDRLGLRLRDALRWESNPIVRRLIFARARQSAVGKTRGHSPAAERIVETVQAGHDRGLHRGLWAEARAFGELATSPQSSHLVHVHRACCELLQGTRQLSSAPGGSRLNRVGILGGYTLASEIALLVSADPEITVVFQGIETESTGLVRRAVERCLTASVTAGGLGQHARIRALDRLREATTLAGLQDCQLVIETVAEDLGKKRRTILELEATGNPERVIATTTAAWTVRRVAEVSRHPEQVVGLHYGGSHGGPALLELIVGKNASMAVPLCSELAERQRKTLLLVGDGPGGYLPRLAASLLLEQLHLIAEGVSTQILENALLDWGFSANSLEGADARGARYWAELSSALARSSGSRWHPPEMLLQLGREGVGVSNTVQRQRAPRGYARQRLTQAWSTLMGTKSRAVLRASEIAQRCAMRVVNEAVLCYEEGLLQNARDGDVGAVQGIGFPASRGGPFRYVDEVGAAEIVRRLERLLREPGERFAPAALLLRMASGAGTFYGSTRLPPGAAAAGVR